jgi:anti-sigma B factor antagonist
MEILKTVNGEELNVSLDGRLDTITSTEFDAFLSENLQGIGAITIDCEKLSYISSAGLRVLLATQKKMKGALKLKNVQEVVMEVFEITGFVDVLTIE